MAFHLSGFSWCKRAAISVVPNRGLVLLPLFLPFWSGFDFVFGDPLGGLGGWNGFRGGSLSVCLIPRARVVHCGYEISVFSRTFIFWCSFYWVLCNGLSATISGDPVK